MKPINLIDIYERLLPRNQWWSNWQELKDELKYQWDLLTGEDLEKIKNNNEIIIKILQQRYGFNVHQAAKAVNNFFKFQRCNIHLE